MAHQHVVPWRKQRTAHTRTGADAKVEQHLHRDRARGWPLVHKCLQRADAQGDAGEFTARGQ